MTDAELTTADHARTAIWPGLAAGVPKPLMPYSPAITAGGWVFVAGLIASDFETGLAPEVKAAHPFTTDPFEVQGEFILRNLVRTIAAAGADATTDTVRLWNWYVSDRPSLDDFAHGDNGTELAISGALRAHERHLGSVRPPASAFCCRELLVRGTRLEIDMICIPDGGRNEVFGEPGPAGDAPALRRGDWVFLAAQDTAPLAEGSGTSWFDSPVEAQTEIVLGKLAALAAQAGSSLARAVKADVYIGDPADFAAVDRVWQRWFDSDPPARVVIPYMGMDKPGARVAVALTLLADDAEIPRVAVHTPGAPEPLGHEPQAMRAGDFLFFSTQMAFASDGTLAPGMLRHPEFPWYGSPGRAQMKYMMGNIAAICEAAGTSVDQICRRVCFHSDMQWFQESIDEWAAWFPGDKPASTTMRIGGPLVVPGANTLLDLIAYVPPR